MSKPRTSLILYVVVGILAVVSLDTYPHGAHAQEVAAEVPKAQVDEYGQVADSAIEALVRGDAAAFRANLSVVTVLVEQRGPSAIDTIIRDKFIPFFKDYARPGTLQQAFPTYRRLDNAKGVGLARSFIARDGSEHFFVIFVLNEIEHIESLNSISRAPRDAKHVLRIGNLLLDKKIEDVR